MSTCSLAVRTLLFQGRDRGFKSHRVYQKARWYNGRTSPFGGEDSGSIPLRASKNDAGGHGALPGFISLDNRFESVTRYQRGEICTTIRCG